MNDDTSPASESIWYHDITVLSKHVNHLWPVKSMTIEAQVNAMTRLLVIVIAIGYLITNNSMFLVTGLMFIAITAAIGYARLNNLLQLKDNGSLLKYLYSLGRSPNREGFTPTMDTSQVESDIKKAYASNDTTNLYEIPTPNNPLSNVLLTQIHDTPNRKPAPPSFLKEVEDDINKNTKQMIQNQNPDITDMNERLFSNIGDNFTFDRSMRQFYSTPNTQITNDQKGFAEFCYGSMTSCKDGDNIACL